MSAAIDIEETIWLGAARKVLAMFPRPLHYTEIKREILQQSLVAPGLTTTLDECLIKICGQENVDCDIQEDPTQKGYYYLTNAGQVDNTAIVVDSVTTDVQHSQKKASSEKRASAGTSRKRKASTKQMKTKAIKKKAKKAISPPKPVKPVIMDKNTYYKHKFKRLKQRVKELVYTNAAYCDEVAAAQKEFIKATSERRFLLDMVLHLEAQRKQSQAADKSSQESKKILAENKAKELAAAIHRKAIQEESETGQAQSPQKAKKIKPRTNSKSSLPTATAMKTKLSKAENFTFPIETMNLKVRSFGKSLVQFEQCPDMGVWYPIGYCASRQYTALNLQHSTAWYTCRILESSFGVQFEIATEDRSQVFHGSTADMCYNKFVRALNEARQIDVITNPADGYMFFGLIEPHVRNLIEKMVETQERSRCYQVLPLSFASKIKDLQWNI